MPDLPSLPTSFARADLEAAGFAGWRTWDQLRASAFKAIPTGPAAYVIYRQATTAPAYLEANPGGRSKQRDPSVEPDLLARNWVVGSHVIYIGKADNAERRLSQFARFGAGEPVVDWGGRYIWQLAGSGDLLVAWHTVTWEETARAYEKRLLAHFADLHGGVRPFANLTG